MPIYRVIAAVNTAPGHYDGYRPGDPLVCVTACAGGNPIVFAIDAETTDAVLDDMWVLGNRVRDDRQGRCWPNDIRSLSTGDVLIVYPPGHPRVPPAAFAVAPVGFDPVPAPGPVFIGGTRRFECNISPGAVGKRARAPRLSPGGIVTGRSPSPAGLTATCQAARATATGTGRRA